MTLAALIRKRDPVATAIHAIPATTGVAIPGTVAKIATIAVANPSDEDGLKRSEAIEERAAIIEFDGGTGRAEAERLALLEDQCIELESLLAIVGQAYRTPDHEYAVMRERARGDLANALTCYRSMVMQISGAIRGQQ